MKTIRRVLSVLLLSGVVVLATAGPSFAHDAPDQGQAAWLMADWMLLSFLVFFLAALFGFVIAVRRGYLRNLEQAKYHILTIDEEDYYTPDWAREEVTDGA
ncbi:MAG TPA: hypothetical protein VE646_02340 [Actinomycetota bacterium]|jgi:hypothetical protein|nr:hypothetical protein [Actinomycetota bacterium]